MARINRGSMLPCRRGISPTVPAHLHGGLVPLTLSVIERSTPIMLRFSILFIVLLLGLFVIEVLQPVQQHVVLQFTAGLADISGCIIRLFDSGVGSAGKVITDIESGFAVSIEPGCNGVEALIVLFAAIFAFPAALKHKLIGFGIGFIAIQALNLVRIISLFYLKQWNMTWFEWFLLYPGQA